MTKTLSLSPLLQPNRKLKKITGVILLVALVGTFLFILNWCTRPSVVIVPHHNLVASTRFKLLQTVARSNVNLKTIVILGPDHFGNNQKLITTADTNWKLDKGELLPDKNFVSNLSSIAVSNDQLVKDDHAVYNLLPDIHALWPHAKIVPILIGQQYDFNQLSSLINVLYNNCRSQCLVVASVDFSHYLPAALADIHDQTSIQALTNLDLDSIKYLEVDSPQSLFVAASIAKLNSYNRFHLFAHTNSGFISQNPDIETTTHVMGYFQNSVLKFTSNIHTFTYLPIDINRRDNQETVGDRFFYGVDELRVNNKIDQLRQSIPDDFVVSGYYDNQTLTVSYFPVSLVNGRLNFLRGQSKIDKIKTYFDSLNLPYLSKDYYWSTIKYDIREHSHFF